MASAFVIWERRSQSFVGGAQPLVFAASADATEFLVGRGNPSTSGFKGLYDQTKATVPQPIYDVVTVTVP
jgi:hypothetical protein